MNTRQRATAARGSAKERSDKAVFYLRYLEYLEKTGTTLIAQARKLEVLTDAAVCAVAGGAAGLAVVFLFVWQMNLGEVEKIGACSSIPLFFACGGLILGRFLPGRAVRVRQDDLRRINQEQATGWQLIDKVTEELDALPKRKENSVRRLELERRLVALRDREAALAAQIQQLESHRFPGGGSFGGPFRHVQRVMWSDGQRATREDSATQALIERLRSELDIIQRAEAAQHAHAPISVPADVGDDKRGTSNRDTEAGTGELVPAATTRVPAEQPPRT
ncbi:hypothetical protein VOI32_18555 [Paraburkholderia caribensis]|uniref:Uncharacterized protein n=1 Tax=Paraburkholderia caribensis TaxID=75105 RepID=A0A9Q6S1P3_9BURK|nr:hypothetical protein [Paraburkholderia caribensis]MCO4879926.1 hypothetical protein [Paraburkholderia caribensis]PTB27765.1 hypothetical protein C9I56_16250 [Paraburkholderia caribensis]QLB62953.1 hypothetical protein A9O66_11505 [Paraburkholderia caribensis]